MASSFKYVLGNRFLALESTQITLTVLDFPTSKDVDDDEDEEDTDAPSFFGKDVFPSLNPSPA